MKDHWFSFKDACVRVTEQERSAFFSGPPYSYLFFFLHGRFEEAEAWSPWMIQLSRNFHCLALDLPGFGRSFTVGERPFSLLDHASLVQQVTRKLALDEEEIVWVGSDIGAGIAQLCSLEFFQKTAAAVLINPASISEGFPNKSTGTLHWRPLWKRVLRGVESSWPQHYERLFWKRKLRETNIPTLLLWTEEHRPLAAEAEVLARVKDFVLNQQLEKATNDQRVLLR